MDEHRLNDYVYYRVVPAFVNVVGEPFLGELQLYNNSGDLLGKIYSDRSRTDWKGSADIFINKKEMAQLHAIADTLDEPLKKLDEADGEKDGNINLGFLADSIMRGPGYTTSYNEDGDKTEE